MLTIRCLNGPSMVPGLPESHGEDGGRRLGASWKDRLPHHGEGMDHLGLLKAIFYYRNIHDLESKKGMMFPTLPGEGLDFIRVTAQERMLE